MKNKQQFLTDEEYEAIKRDMNTILDGIELETSFDIPRMNDASRRQAIAKLTAYVDQKIKEYY